MNPKKIEREQVYRKLNDVFREVIDNETITTYEWTIADDIEDWGSL